MLKLLQEIAIRNLDYILTVSTHAFAGTSLDILVNLEKLLDSKSSETWSHRRLPTPTAKFPAIINSEEEEGDSELLRSRDDDRKGQALKDVGGQRLDSFLQSSDAVLEDVNKQIRALRKKLQQIELLEEKRFKGQFLDDQQILKLQMRAGLEKSLAELGAPVESLHTAACSAVDECVSKKLTSRKQKRKSKQKASHKEEGSSDFAIGFEKGIAKGFPEAEVPEDTLKVQVS